MSAETEKSLQELFKVCSREYAKLKSSISVIEQTCKDTTFGFGRVGLRVHKDHFENLILSPYLQAMRDIDALVEKAAKQGLLTSEVGDALANHVRRLIDSALEMANDDFIEELAPNPADTELTVKNTLRLHALAAARMRLRLEVVAQTVRAASGSPDWSYASFTYQSIRDSDAARAFPQLTTALRADFKKNINDLDPPRKNGAPEQNALDNMSKLSPEAYGDIERFFTAFLGLQERDAPYLDQSMLEGWLRDSRDTGKRVQKKHVEHFLENLKRFEELAPGKKKAYPNLTPEILRNIYLVVNRILIDQPVSDAWAETIQDHDVFWEGRYVTYYSFLTHLDVEEIKKTPAKVTELLSVLDGLRRYFIAKQKLVRNSTSTPTEKGERAQFLQKELDWIDSVLARMSGVGVSGTSSSANTQGTGASGSNGKASERLQNDMQANTRFIEKYSWVRVDENANLIVGKYVVQQKHRHYIDKPVRSILDALVTEDMITWDDEERLSFLSAYALLLRSEGKDKDGKTINPNYDKLAEMVEMMIPLYQGDKIFSKKENLNTDDIALRWAGAGLGNVSSENSLRRYRALRNMEAYKKYVDKLARKARMIMLRGGKWDLSRASDGWHNGVSVMAFAESCLCYGYTVYKWGIIPEGPRKQTFINEILNAQKTMRAEEDRLDEVPSAERTQLGLDLTGGQFVSHDVEFVKFLMTFADNSSASLSVDTFFEDFHPPKTDREKGDNWGPKDVAWFIRDMAWYEASLRDYRTEATLIHYGRLKKSPKYAIGSDMPTKGPGFLLEAMYQIKNSDMGQAATLFGGLVDLPQEYRGIEFRLREYCPEIADGSPDDVAFSAGTNEQKSVVKLQLDKYKRVAQSFFEFIFGEDFSQKFERWTPHSAIMMPTISEVLGFDPVQGGSDTGKESFKNYLQSFEAIKKLYDTITTCWAKPLNVPHTPSEASEYLLGLAKDFGTTLAIAFSFDWSIIYEPGSDKWRERKEDFVGFLCAATRYYMLYLLANIPLNNRSLLWAPALSKDQRLYAETYEKLKAVVIQYAHNLNTSFNGYPEVIDAYVDVFHHDQFFRKNPLINPKQAARKFWNRYLDDFVNAHEMEHSLHGEHKHKNPGRFQKLLGSIGAVLAPPNSMLSDLGKAFNQEFANETLGTLVERQLRETAEIQGAVVWPFKKESKSDAGAKK